MYFLYFLAKYRNSISCGERHIIYSYMHTSSPEDKWPTGTASFTTVLESVQADVTRIEDTNVHALCPQTPEGERRFQGSLHWMSNLHWNEWAWIFSKEFIQPCILRMNVVHLSYSLRNNVLVIQIDEHVQTSIQALDLIDPYLVWVAFNIKVDGELEFDAFLHCLLQRWDLLPSKCVPERPQQQANS